MKKLFAVLLLLSVCLSAQALTYPPWWMLSGSAGANGVASFGVPFVFKDGISGQGTMDVRSNTTDGADTAADYIAKWNGSAFVHYGDNAFNTGVESIAVSTSGIVYACGGFIGKLRYYNAGTWDVVGNGTYGAPGTLFYLNMAQ